MLIHPNKKFNPKSKIIREDKIQKHDETNVLFDPCFEDFQSAFYGRVLK